MKKSIGIREIISGICASAALGFMLFIYAPLELYSVNKKEFWFEAKELFPFMILFFLLILVGSSIVFYIANRIHPIAYRVLLVIYFIALVCTYIQGNFLVGDLPSLDGTGINWADYSQGRIKTIVLWLIVTLIVVIAVKFMKQDVFDSTVRIISVCMALMLLVTIVSVCATNKTFEQKLSYNISAKNMFEMSEDKNFIILLLDAFDGYAFSELVGNNQEYAEIFENFTFYKNTMSAYPYTRHSIPFILSGDWYENDEEFQNYENNVYKNSELFSRLEAENYKMGIYTTDLDSQDESIYRFDNIYGSELYVSSYAKLIKQEIKLIGFRYAPFDFKRFCVIKKAGFEEICATASVGEESYESFRCENDVFYGALQEEPLIYTDGKNCFKFIHLDGAHVPYIYDKDVNVIEEESGSYEQNMQSCVTLTKAYLEKLKAANVYDNSVIIVMADHGYNTNNTAYGRQTPLLLIKGVNEKHGFETSEAPISYVDLLEAYNRLLEGKSSAECFDYQEGDQRERRYLFYKYECEDTMTEQMQTGMAWDMDTLVPTGREFIR